MEKIVTPSVKAREEKPSSSNSGAETNFSSDKRNGFVRRLDENGHS
jgi:hypothetical protein